jgi:hypothetical protein
MAVNRSQHGPDRRAVRLLAIGGVVGPVAFVTAWVSAGSATSGYSPVNDAISDLAATHAPARTAMTLGFVAFGAGVIAFGCALRQAQAGPAWVCAVATAGFTLAVAATPLGASVRDVIHGTFASLGYVTLVAVPVLASRTLARTGRLGWMRYSRATGVLAGSCLLASALGPVHGLFQRVGLTAGDAWLVAVASQLVLARELF